MGSITNKIENFQMIVNEDFVKKAKALEPELHSKVIRPGKMVEIGMGDTDWEVKKEEPAGQMTKKELAKGDSICFDFEDHRVGYVTIKFGSAGSPPDAPAHIRIRLGEKLCEIMEDASDYEFSISSSWIQEEFFHIDVLPAVLEMPRRYAFRYMEIKVLDTSPKYQLTVESVQCETVSSGDRTLVEPLPESMPNRLKKMDEVSLKTMEDCMQLVFEDGPKRDRRLWIGDLRLQALTNYVTFHNTDLVKRCLYLFAGLTQNEGHVGACLFIEPEFQVDDTSLYDYGLFFISCLYDYYMETQDMETLKELWETAYHQVELAMKRVDENGVVKDSDDWWCFLDWGDNLNKQAGAQGVLLYTARQALELAEILNESEKVKKLGEIIRFVRDGAENELWIEKQGFFVSGADGQISWASQVWLVLANVFGKAKNREILEHLLEVQPSVRMASPYMFHHLVEALLENDLKDEALLCMENYWGKMLDDGADCFYELYDPENPKASPYGSRIINSYCHAWSCTPSYFIRKYFTMYFK